MTEQQNNLEKWYESKDGSKTKLVLDSRGNLLEKEHYSAAGGLITRVCYSPSVVVTRRQVYVNGHLEKDTLYLDGKSFPLVSRDTPTDKSDEGTDKEKNVLKEIVSSHQLSR